MKYKRRLHFMGKDLLDPAIQTPTTGMTTGMIREEKEVMVEKKEVAPDHPDSNREESLGPGQEEEMIEVTENLLMSHILVRNLTYQTVIFLRILKS